MATYNKPGVYIEESLSPNVPVANTAVPSTAAFIGYADRGPTTTVSGNVSGLPTLITSWSDFINNFSFGSGVNTFAGIPQVTLTGATLSTTSQTVTVTSGANALRVGSTLSLSGTTSAALASGTVVTGVTNDTTFSISALPSAAGTSTTIVATPPKDLKYAVKTFFDNGGGQAYILRDINPDASKAQTSIRDSGNVVNVTGAVTFDAYTTNFGNKVVTVTAASGTPFANFAAGQVVSISGVDSADSNYQILNGNSWVVSTATNTVLTLAFSPAGAIATSGGTTYATSAPLVVTGGGNSASNTLTVKAKNEGSWGNNVWVAVTPNPTQNYFDITVYYSTTANSSTDLTSANIVERFIQLSADSADPRYFLSAVNSSWIELADGGSGATGASRLPAFTGTWGAAAGSANLVGTNGAFSWKTSGFSASPVAVRLSATTSARVQSAVSAGSDGATPKSSSDLVSRFDLVSTPLIVNWANNQKTQDINQLLAYVSGRGDSFAVLDAANTTLSSVLGSTTDVGIGSYAGNVNFGAAYYPNIVIADPSSSTGGTKTVAPGGSVVALITATDANRGVFKAPAGTTAIIRSAVSVPSLSNSDFTSVSQNNVNLNIIRFVPGSGICVMGARTLSNGYSDRYVPVRRTVNFLGYSLKNLTEFAIFEPNDQNLWNTVNGIIGRYLTDFWRSGGLAGATASEAFYVKCDSTINTPSSIQAGELHIEIGVALQRPAEFVVIKIGQLDGGATVTTSI